MTAKNKKNKGSRKSPEKEPDKPDPSKSPEKTEPDPRSSDVESQSGNLTPGDTPEQLPPEKPPEKPPGEEAKSPSPVRTRTSSKLSTHVKQMLLGKGFEIKSGVVQHTDGLSEENRETIVSNLMANEEALCRINASRIRQTFAGINPVGPFGRWLTNNYSRAIHVRLPLSVYYDVNSSRPMRTLQIHKSNIAIHIREEIKSQIQTYIEDNPEYIVCTDIERVLLMVEEMEITYFPLQEDGKTPGNVDRKATPLILGRSSDLSEILRDHTVYTTSIQL